MGKTMMGLVGAVVVSLGLAAVATPAEAHERDYGRFHEPDRFRQEGPELRRGPWDWRHHERIERFGRR